MSDLGFKRLIGNRIYLEMPKMAESSIILDEASKAEFAEKEAKKLTRLKVLAVGTSITNELVEVGDVILVEQGALQKAPIVPLTETKSVILISPFDIIHVW